jgi:hypothetical protein
MIGQQANTVTTLWKSISETSGIIYLNERLITHNDSGGLPALYEVDTTNGEVARIVIIENAFNKDWEDICHDNTHIYVGDFGNNLGNRTDLKVYKISIEDYLHTDTVSAEIISFNYADQTVFTNAPFVTNFDAEGLIAYHDSLYIFTKNWGNNRTNIYALPKTPGSYSIIQVDNFFSNGLITGADYNATTHKVVLTGAALIVPFIIEIEGFTGNQFSNGIRKRYFISVQDATQIEAVAAINDYQYFLTAEEGIGGSATLYRLAIDQILSEENFEWSEKMYYPNPASDWLKIDLPLLVKVEIYDTKGALQLSSTDTLIDVSKLIKGVYAIHIYSENSSIGQVGKLIID